MPLDQLEYMCMKFEVLPAVIVKKFNLHQFVDFNGWVNIKIMKGMYGLPQARLLANKLLKQCLVAWSFY